MTQERPDVLPVRRPDTGVSRRARCSVCHGEYERGQTCERCGHDQPIGERRLRGRQGLISELQDFLSNLSGSLALILGVLLPLSLSIVLSALMLLSLLFGVPNYMGDRLFNLALLFLIFLVWASVVDLGIILFVYFLRDRLYDYHWSWPVRQGRRPGVVQLAGVALMLFLILGLVTALLPMAWSVEPAGVEAFGLSGQDFWRGVLVTFLLSMSFASFVLFLMLLDAADYIARRDEQTVPPIYMDVNKLLKVVLDTVRQHLAVASSTLLSLERTKSGGLQLLLKVLQKSPGEGEPPSIIAERKAPSQYTKYEVVSDQWGFLVSLKEKKDW